MSKLEREVSFTELPNDGPILSQKSDGGDVSLPFYNLEIDPESIKRIGDPHRIDRGFSTKYLYTFLEHNRGKEPETSEHYVSIYRPNRPKFDRVLLNTPPWFIGLDGYSELLGEYAVQKNMTLIEISDEVGSIIKAIQNIGHVSLAREAAKQLVLHEHLASEGYFSPDEAIGVGYSRGLEIMVAAAALAHQFKKKVVYGEGMDAGPANKIDICDVDLCALPKNVYTEGRELVKGIAASPLSQLVRLRHSVPISLQAVIQDIATGLALASDEAGELAREVPKDSLMNLVFFNNCSFNQLVEWRHIFANHPFVNIQVKNGAHLTGSNPVWPRRAIGHVALVQAELKSIPPQAIDLDKITKKVEKKIKDGRF